MEIQLSKQVQDPYRAGSICLDLTFQENKEMAGKGLSPPWLGSRECRKLLQEAQEKGSRKCRKQLQEAQEKIVQLQAEIMKFRAQPKEAEEDSVEPNKISYGSEDQKTTQGIIVDLTGPVPQLTSKESFETSYTQEINGNLTTKVKLQTLENVDLANQEVKEMTMKDKETNVPCNEQVHITDGGTRPIQSCDEPKIYRAKYLQPSLKNWNKTQVYSNEYARLGLKNSDHNFFIDKTQKSTPCTAKCLVKKKFRACTELD
jgi:hypothetical protein